MWKEPPPSEQGKGFLEEGSNTMGEEKTDFTSQPKLSGKFKGWEGRESPESRIENRQPELNSEKV